ncbi:MAG TPA: Fur family transcriptional regulator [Candidatus Cloacimonadota bacterium]|nr:Fur family transcriptional regulator [Candidatus Cloacimonadota bacterium]HPT71282.1 Fur family transcriptional regulator [Candidatus Cloacimonadota bacterium]
MKDYLNAFKSYLKVSGAKLTNQRSIILDAVFSIHSHFDAESLFIQIQKTSQNEQVSLTSIYRTLPLLLEAGLIRRSPGNPNKEQYEHVYGHPDHCHLECIHCGKIIEKRLTPEQKTSLNELAEKSNFQSTTVEIHLTGYCKSCREKVSGWKKKI